MCLFVYIFTFSSFYITILSPLKNFLEKILTFSNLKQIDYANEYVNYVWNLQIIYDKPMKKVNYKLVLENFYESFEKIMR